VFSSSVTEALSGAKTTSRSSSSADRHVDGDVVTDDHGVVAQIDQAADQPFAPGVEVAVEVAPASLHGLAQPRGAGREVVGGRRNFGHPGLDQDLTLPAGRERLRGFACACKRRGMQFERAERGQVPGGRLGLGAAQRVETGVVVPVEASGRLAVADQINFCHRLPFLRSFPTIACLPAVGESQC
jgi:hypothetical protein